MPYTLTNNRRSPNFTSAPNVPRAYGRSRQILGITAHYWGADGQKFDNVVNYLCRKHGNSSAHEVIEAGRVEVIVNHADAAWHSGTSLGNATHIGLELNPRASEEDYITAAERIRDLRAAYGDLPLKAHKQWKATACPGRWDLAKLDRMARGQAVPVSQPVVTAPVPAKSWVVIAPGVPAPAFPLPPGWYFGPKEGPKQSVSGFYSYREELKQWQQRMKDRGWNIKVDGLYGDETGDVAEAFQREKNLGVDRLIGPETWGAAWTTPITRWQ